MMILAYFRIKFSSLKMKRDRVLAPWKPGRLRWAAFFAIWPRDPSKGPVMSKPSRSTPPDENVAILKFKRQNIINLITGWANSAVYKLITFFSYFSKKTGFDISCKLSTEETVYTKCQSLFSPKEAICMKYQTRFPLGKNNKKKWMVGCWVLSSILSSVLILIDAQYRKRDLM